MEYENMKKNLDIILDNIVILAEQIGFSDDIDKMVLMSMLINFGYLSKNDGYNGKVTEEVLELYQGAIFELGLIPIIGNGCCRHISSLAKLILDKFAIKNEVTAAIKLKELKGKSDIDSLLMKSEMIKQESYCNHALNIVRIGNKDIALNLLPGVGSMLYSINQNVAVEFFEDVDLGTNYLIYNYSPFFEGRKDFDRIKPLNIEEQEEILRGGKNAMLVTRANIDLLEEFYTNNRPYMEEIDNSYKKILVKEKRL